MRDIILEKGWQQGSVFKAADVPDGVVWDGGKKQKHIFVVLPYSCAVVSDNLNEEPVVEVIRLSKIINDVPHWRHAQHPRALVLSLLDTQTGNNVFWKARMADRFFLPKDALSSFSPDDAYFYNYEH